MLSHPIHCKIKSCTMSGNTLIFFCRVGCALCCLKGINQVQVVLVWVFFFSCNAEILTCFIVFPLLLASIKKLSSFIFWRQKRIAVSGVCKFCFQWSVFPFHVWGHKTITICISEEQRQEATSSSRLTQLCSSQCPITGQQTVQKRLTLQSLV